MCSSLSLDRKNLCGLLLGETSSKVAQMVKRLPTMWVTQVQSLGWEDPLEKEMAPHSGTLAWKIPWTEEATIHWVAKSRTRLSNFTSLHFTSSNSGSFLSCPSTSCQRWEWVAFQLHVQGGTDWSYSAAAAAELLQSCPTLSDPMDCSPSGSSFHGIFQARVLECGAIAFSVILLIAFKSGGAGPIRRKMMKDLASCFVPSSEYSLNE